MRMFLVAVVILVASAAHALDGKYFDAIWEGDNVKHPIISVGTNLTMKGKFDGASTPVALVWHKSDPKNSLIPDNLQNMGFKPFGWTILGCGAGYGNGTGSLTCGSSVNVAPTLLGPIAQVLKTANSPLAQGAGAFIAGSPTGSGLALGYTWSNAPVQGGTIMPLNRWGSHLDAFLGLSYDFR